jgi:OFA family oxalate/formate antiporter-like MFS transporter
MTNPKATDAAGVPAPSATRLREAALEFWRGWPVVLAGAVGAGVGIIPTTFALLIMMKPLQAEFGWKRSDITIASSFFTLGLFLAGGTFGRLYDRYGVRKVGAISVLLFAFTLAGLSQVRVAIWTLYGGYFCIGFFGAGTSYLPYARAVTTWFDKGRGLALALTTAGPAVSAALIPQLLPAVITRYSWRGGYLALAGAALVALPMLLIVRERRAAGVAESAVGGLTLSKAMRTRQFWFLAAGIASISLSLVGTSLHFLPMLADLGASPKYAAYAISTYGLSVLGGRLVTGALLDNFPARLVAGALFCLPPIGFVVFHIFGVKSALVLAVAMGLATGTEADALSYSASRYFGLRSYSEIFGWLYGAMALGSAGSPFLIGALYIRAPDYSLVLATAGALALLAALLFSTLGPYPESFATTAAV